MRRCFAVFTNKCTHTHRGNESLLVERFAHARRGEVTMRRHWANFCVINNKCYCILWNSYMYTDFDTFPRRDVFTYILDNLG